MFFKKGLGIGLIFTGIYLIITNAFITGAVVGLGTENMLSMLGVFVFFIGVVLIITDVTLERRVKKEDPWRSKGETEEVEPIPYDEIFPKPGSVGGYGSKGNNEAHNSAGYQRLKDSYRQKRSRFHLDPKFEQYNPTEISPKEIDNLKTWANNMVESGKWVELKAITVRSAENQIMYKQGTSLCRYWGPKRYKNYSGKKLEDLYLGGKIGKTHEIVRGSDKYKEGGSLIKGNVSMPPKGSGVLHRHWEIDRMYRYGLRPAEED